MSSLRLKTSFLVLCTLLLAIDLRAERRALLVGINDYTASHLGKPVAARPRDYTNLNGAVTDVELLKQMLVLVYGVDARQVVTLTDQAATRAAILDALQSLVNRSARGDVVLFYFAGHGSQVPNSRSDERDKLDESIVPADSRRGVDDIRDKELRPYFNRILDRGARLTVVLDSCHSGSGARGLPTDARVRAVKRDTRDVADGRRYGPRPENRGALVLAAAEDTGEAREVRDAEGRFHGVFSWAWIRSLRDSCSGEPAVETFYRAQARMRTEPPFQSPVIAGTPDVKLAPFLGTRLDRRGDRAVVAVGRIDGDSVALQGGWANDLAVGTELRDVKSGARLKVIAVRGMGESAARVTAGAPPATGALVEVVGWAAPPGPPLRVDVPRAPRDFDSIRRLAKALNEKASQRGIRWIVNPIDSAPSHVLRWNGRAWEIVLQDGRVEHVGGDGAALAAVTRMPPGTSLFAQLPAPAAMADAIDSNSSAPPADADYILVGRYSSRRLTYAWLRPLVRRRDKRRTSMPLQTAWTKAAPDLEKALMRLRRLYAWGTLQSPPQARFPYHLRIRRARDARLIGENDSIVTETAYKLYIGRDVAPPVVKRRYIYAFVIDSAGRSTLLFPIAEQGSVENYLPDRGAPLEIPLDGSGFEADAPFGVDTYVLLTTDEPLPNPAILEWDGVRARRWQPKSALEQLLALTAAGKRAASIATPATWSIERLSVESIRSRATKSGP